MESSRGGFLYFFFQTVLKSLKWITFLLWLSLGATLSLDQRRPEPVSRTCHCPLPTSHPSLRSQAPGGPLDGAARVWPTIFSEMIPEQAHQPDLGQTE